MAAAHFLHYHPGWLGLAQSAVIFLALWWAWMFTTWAANWADPERVPVRLARADCAAIGLIPARHRAGRLELHRQNWPLAPQAQSNT